MFPLKSKGRISDSFYMMEDTGWSKHFNISDEQLSKWRQHALTQKESLILWVLKNKKINPRAYEDWAFQKYKIPRLKVTYFQKNKLNKTLLGRRSPSWPDHVLPIKEYKGTLYLTCLHPVSDLKVQGQVQWILSPVEGILLWQKQRLHSTSQNTSLSNVYPLHAPSSQNPSNPILKPSVPKHHTSSPISKETNQNGHFQGVSQEGYKDVLKNLAEYFDQNMILLIKNTVLRPWKWDQSWVKNASVHHVIPLNKPSIFHIVYKTKQKYHGYVIVNPTNDDFFQTWNQGRYPEHVTILPLIQNKKIIGMLLGGTSTKKGKDLSLEQLDILALRAAEKIKLAG